MGVATSSTDPEIQSLQDQLNGQSRQFGIVNGKFPTGAPAGSLATYQTRTTINFHLADATGKFGDAIAIPKSLQYFTGLTQSAGAPTTTEIPTPGGFGWHLNTSTGAYYFALNNAGSIVFPNFVSIAGTLGTGQHGDLTAAGVVTMHPFTQISGTITAAQHGNLTTGTLHPFTVISGTITAAQHAAQTDSTLHAAATTTTAGFMSAAQAATLADVTTAETPTNFLNCTQLRVSGTKVVGARVTGYTNANLSIIRNSSGLTTSVVGGATVPDFTAANFYIIGRLLLTLLNDLGTSGHGLLDA